MLHDCENSLICAHICAPAIRSNVEQYGAMSSRNSDELRFLVFYSGVQSSS